MPCARNSGTVVSLASVTHLTNGNCFVTSSFATPSKLQTAITSVSGVSARPLKEERVLSSAARSFEAAMTIESFREAGSRIIWALLWHAFFDIHRSPRRGPVERSRKRPSPSPVSVDYRAHRRARCRLTGWHLQSCPDERLWPQRMGSSDHEQSPGNDFLRAKQPVPLSRTSIPRTVACFEYGRLP